MSSSWEEIHPDLLYEIAKSLISSEDEEGRNLKAFGMVCKSWRSVWFQVKQNPKQIWLMLAEKDDSTKRSFYNLADGNIFNMNLPECSRKQCIYFTETKGWLITCGEDSEVNLLNLFTRVQIKLPSIRILNNPEEVIKFPCFILRASLSADPSLCSDFTVIILYWTGMLAFARPGDKTWRVIPKPNNFCDAIFYNGRVYAIDWIGNIWICDNIGDSKSEPVATMLFPNKPPCSVYIFERMYLFRSCEKLLVAFRIGIEVSPVNEGNEDDTYGCNGFDVYELNLSEKNWMKVTSLENKTLFVGHNTSLCVPASTIYGCKPNCIYFTDDCEESYLYDESSKGGKDMGVYNMEDRSIELHYKEQSLSRFCPPLWIFPNIL